MCTRGQRQTLTCVKHRRRGEMQELLAPAGLGYECAKRNSCPQDRAGPLQERAQDRAILAIWLMLCLNISAGIGVIGMASPMLQEIFAGALIGRSGVSLADLSAAQLSEIAAIGAGFTDLLSLFNIGGRLFWAPRPRADRVVDRRHHRSRAGQLPARAPDRSRRAARQRL